MGFTTLLKIILGVSIPIGIFIIGWYIVHVIKKNQRLKYENDDLRIITEYERYLKRRYDKIREKYQKLLDNTDSNSS